jgi:hypothetical protein
MPISDISGYVQKHEALHAEQTGKGLQDLGSVTSVPQYEHDMPNFFGVWPSLPRMWRA